MCKGDEKALRISPEELDRVFASLPFGIPRKPNLNGGLAPEDSSKLNEKEREAVGGHRRTKGSLSDACGLALSGGGIRSATFCLGVCQVLAANRLLTKFDFLSTVSGGGYTGAFISRQLGNGKEDEVGCPDGPDTPAIGNLRQKAKYLSSYGLWGRLSMLLSSFSGMLLNWSVPFAVLIVTVLSRTMLQSGSWMDLKLSWSSGTIMRGVVSILAIVAWTIASRKNWYAWICDRLVFCVLMVFVLYPIFDGSGDWRPYWPWMTTLVVVTIVSAVPYFTLLRIGLPRGAAVFGWLHVLLFLILGVVLVYGGLEKAVILTKDGWGGLLPKWENLRMLFVAAGPVAAIMIPSALRFLPLIKDPTTRRVALVAALIISGTIIPLSMAAAYVALSHVSELPVGALPGWKGIQLGPLIIPQSGFGLLATLGYWCAFLALCVLNINITGPHRQYRDGISATFVEGTADGGRLFPLFRMNEENRAPYHLINAAVNLPTETNSRLTERKTDFFLFSKFWTGSPLVGYVATDKWWSGVHYLDLASATAISGAAVSSNMGLSSRPLLRSLLTFLNVRLGVWLRHPDKPGLLGLPKWRHPGFVCLLREMTGLFMASKHSWMNVSDGGHIENLAVYELLRRRCKFIVCVDAEADPAYGFHGLMTLVRHARIDMGIRILTDLDEIRPDPVTGFSKRHGHLCRIHYPEGHTGLLLYLKLSITGDESDLIRRYRDLHPDFPHQTTLDQFFDEEQFEAYRELGVHVAREVLSSSTLAEATSPASIGGWFRNLARKLVVPG